MLTFTDGNVTWSTGPKEIANTNQQVIVEETGFEKDRVYDVTAKVITQYGNITSSGKFSKSFLYSFTVFIVSLLQLQGIHKYTPWPLQVSVVCQSQLV